MEEEEHLLVKIWVKLKNLGSRVFIRKKSERKIKPFVMNIIELMIIDLVLCWNKIFFFWQTNGLPYRCNAWPIWWGEALNCLSVTLMFEMFCEVNNCNCEHAAKFLWDENPFHEFWNLNQMAWLSGAIL